MDLNKREDLLTKYKQDLVSRRINKNYVQSQKNYRQKYVICE